MVSPMQSWQRSLQGRQRGIRRVRIIILCIIINSKASGRFS
jgi:hypothetical protein